MDRINVAKIAGILMVAALIGLTGPDGADAFGDKKCPEMFGGKGMDHHEGWLKKLDLTADQKKKLDAVREERKAAMKSTMEQARAEHEKLHQLMQGDAPEADLRAQHDKVLEFHTAGGKERFESMLKIRAILTPDQRKKMGEMGKSMREECMGGKDAPHKHGTMGHGPK